MITVAQHVRELDDRMDAAVLLIDETHHASATGSLPGPVAKEARGLAVVMLFAAYENLLRSLTQTLLEGAVRCRVSNRRLQPGLLTFALVNTAKGARAKSEKKLYSHSIPDLIDVFRADQRHCTIDTSAFPDDGSFMKSSQVELWCRLFNAPHPGSLLRRTWMSLDGVVSQRNAVAHGRATPGDIGRGYTETEIRDLIDDWRDDWTDFLTAVQALASHRDFFRVP